MKEYKFEKDCRISFYLSCLYKYGSSKGAELILEDGMILQVPIPYSVRYSKTPYLKWLKSEEGQLVIEQKLNRYKSN